MEFKFTRYYEQNVVREKTIQGLAKEFAKELFNTFRVSDVIGIELGFPRKEDGQCRFYMTYQITPYILNYHTIFIDKDLNIVNNQLYEVYLPDYADQLTELFNTVLETYNLLSKVGVEMIYDNDEIFEFFGIQMHQLRNCTEIQNENNIDEIIQLYRNFQQILRNFDKYKRLYEANQI